MKKIIKQGKHTGYAIGKDVEIHEHIHYPEDWMLTVRPLQIYSERLCSKDCSDVKIRKYVLDKLNAKREVIEKIISSLEL